MHEMSLAENVLQILEDAARRRGFARVRSVRLEVGALAPVEPAAMRFCFDAVTRGSIAEGARLDITTTHGMAWCMRCSDTISIERRYDTCPKCGGHELQVTGGEELRVKELEVD